LGGVSLTTRPPGDAARPEPARPAGPAGAAGAVGGTTGLQGVPPGAAVATPLSPAGGLAGTPPLRTPMPEGAAALRVFVEEVRAAAQAQLSGAARADALPPLADSDPGNAVAALLRWLRAASAGAPLSPAALQKIVEHAHARATEQLPRAGGAPAQAGGGVESIPGARGTAPGDAPRSAGPAGTTARAGTADTSALVRETLATARDLVLRALLTAGDARATPAAAGAEGSASRARDATAVGAALATSREPSAAASATRGAAGAPGVESRTHVVSESAGGSVPNVAAPGSAIGAPLGPSSAAAVASTSRVPPIDGASLLRNFVDEIRAELGRTVGATRLPSAPPPLVTDAHGAQLGPALLRWLTSAVAEKGVPLAPLQEAVRAAHGRAAAALPPLEPAATPGALPAARDALLAVRDHVLRGLGVAPDRLEVAAAREPAGPRADARVDLPVGDPRGVPLGAGALVPLGERVEEIGARRRSRRDEPGTEDGEEPPPDVRPGADDLQGPMDCIRRYFDAYLAGDSAGYAAQWVYPACVWSGGRWSAYANAAACARANDEYTRKARAEGIVGGRIVMLRVEPTTEDVAVVHAVFERERADGTVAGETETAYTTVRTEAGWRVAVCIVKK
jgi:hypothetical protein